jgi:NAD(P)-dependent dehydrogenase (short-subunit alcohol dehydrogenase family)
MNSPGPAVVITGAFGALGQAVARAFEDRGARLALLDVSPQPRPSSARSSARRRSCSAAWT